MIIALTVEAHKKYSWQIGSLRTHPGDDLQAMVPCSVALQQKTDRQDRSTVVFASPRQESATLSSLKETLVSYIPSEAIILLTHEIASPTHPSSLFNDYPHHQLSRSGISSSHINSPQVPTAVFPHIPASTILYQVGKYSSSKSRRHDTAPAVECNITSLLASLSTRLPDFLTHFPGQCAATCSARCGTFRALLPPWRGFVVLSLSESRTLLVWRADVWWDVLKYLARRARQRQSGAHDWKNLAFSCAWPFDRPAG